MDEEKVTKEIFRLREEITVMKDLLNRWLQICGFEDTKPLQTEQLISDTRDALYGGK